MYADVKKFPELNTILYDKPIVYNSLNVINIKNNKDVEFQISLIEKHCVILGKKLLILVTLKQITPDTNKVIKA